LLRTKSLSAYPWLVHGFSTRPCGNQSFATDASIVGENVARNRRRLLAALVPAAGKRHRKFTLVTLRQIHSDIVRVADGQNPRAGREPDGALRLAGDALITDQPHLLLVVQTADCLPIVLVDPERRVVANVHAGWRGTLARIAAKTIGQMQARFGVEPRRLRAVIGPGIHVCCYEVGCEIYERYAAQFQGADSLFHRFEPSASQAHWHPKITGRPLKPFGGTDGVAPAGATTRWFLDLVEANRQQLRAAGLPAAHIAVVDTCTACRPDLFFSHRAEAGRTGRQMALVGLLF
jgi:hypothetical protein